MTVLEIIQPSKPKDHQAQHLVRLFNALFGARYQTVLVLGDGEPIYLPACKAKPWHQVIFANGYFSSALHEIAHWCIAGKKRRIEVDYGYWYRPDGRSPKEQAAFELAEIKPQALEWLFSVAAGHAFQFSADNIEGGACVSASFKLAVWQQVKDYLERGLPTRAQTFRDALSNTFQGPFPLRVSHFSNPQNALESHH